MGGNTLHAEPAASKSSCSLGDFNLPIKKAEALSTTGSSVTPFIPQHKHNQIIKISENFPERFCSLRACLLWIWALTKLSTPLHPLDSCISSSHSARLVPRAAFPLQVTYARVFQFHEGLKTMQRLPQSFSPCSRPTWGTGFSSYLYDSSF